MQKISILLTVAIITFASFTIALGQASQPGLSNNEPPVAVDPFTLLPASDFVMDFQVRRIFDEAIPRVLAKSPAKLAQMNSLLNQLKASTGVDLRTIDRIVAGGVAPNMLNASFGSQGSMPVTEAVVVVQGRFNADALIAVGRIAGGDKVVKQEHAGRSFYTFPLDEKMTGNAMLVRQMNEAAVAAVDRQTLIFGTPSSVRASLEASQAGARSGANAELIRLATLNPHALIGVALNMKPSMNVMSAAQQKSSKPRRALDGIDLIGTPPAQDSSLTGGGNKDEFTKVLESIEQIYFSLGTTATAFDTLLVARTKTPEQARSLNEMLASFKQLLSGSGTQQTSATNLLNAFRTSIENNEFSIQADIKIADISSALADKPSPGIRKRSTATRAARPARAKRRV